MNKKDKIKGRRLNWAEVGATRFSRFCGVAIVKSGVLPIRGFYDPDRVVWKSVSMYSSPPAT